MILLDTHILLWWLSEPKKLSPAARRAINAGRKRRDIAVSAISVFEIRSLLERGRLELAIGADRWFGALISLPEISIEPVSARIAWVAGAFGPVFPGDPADRIIAATGQVLDAELITADQKMRGSGVIRTIW